MHCKNALLAINIVLLLFGSFTSYANELKTDAELLKETVLLAKEVKEFGKSIGISSSQALTQSQQEAQAHALLIIYLKKEGVITPGADIQIQFLLPGNQIRIGRWFINTAREGYSHYWRLITQYGGNEDAAVITIDFAKESLVRRVKVILHEDLHENIKINGTLEESIVTPLAVLAALKFFESKADAESTNETKRLIEELRNVSRELNKLADEAKKAFLDLPLKDAQNYILDLISFYSTYKGYFWRENNIDLLEQLEARISHDLAYYTNFDRIVGLYEQVGDLKILIEDFKGAPADENELTKYLMRLEQKYEHPMP